MSPGLTRPLVALETSSRRPSVAVRLGARALERSLEPGASHAADLLPVLDALLRELDASPRAIGGVLVGLGPGSYTGLRVGIATALGLARGADAAVLGVPSGEVLAFGELSPGEACAHLLDARQGELYFACSLRHADEVEVLFHPRVVRPEELPGLLPPDMPIFGDDTVAEAAGLDAAQRARLRVDRAPRAGALLELGGRRLLRHGPQDPGRLEPLYLRPFKARVRRR